MEGPKLDHLEASVSIGDSHNIPLETSRYRDEYPAHHISSTEDYDFRSHGAASLQLADGTPHVERQSASRAAFRDPGPVDTSPSHTTAELQQSHVFVESNGPTPQSTKQSIYVVHPTNTFTPVTAPRTHLDLGHPNVDLKDSFKSSYQDTHRGEIPPEDSSVFVTRNTFQSTFSINEGQPPSEPISSTTKHTFTTPVVSEADQTTSQDPGRNTRTSISLGDSPAQHVTTASSHYPRPPQEAIANGSPTKPTKSAWDSNVTLGDKDRAKTPTSSSRDSYTRPTTPGSPSRARARLSDSGAILGKEAVSYNTTSSSTFQRPETPPSSPSRRRDLQKSNVQLTSNEASPRTSTARSAYVAPPDSPSSSSSPSPSRKTRSNFSLGSETATYQTTNRTMYNSPPLSPDSPSSPSRPRFRADQISNVVLGDNNKYAMGAQTHTSSSRASYQPHSPSAPTRPAHALQSNFTLG